MATIAITTPSGVSKPASQHFFHSPVSRAFSSLVGAMAVYIEAERDITHARSFDPAFDDWTRDAEAARARVLTLVDAVRSARMTRSEDLPLFRMAMMCYAMIEADSSEEFITAQQVLTSTPSLFTCTSAGAVGWRVRQMLRSCRTRIDEMASLPAHLDPWDIRVDDETWQDDTPDPAMMPIPA